MSHSSESRSVQRPLTPLAACLAATFAVAPLQVCAISVNNCASSGAGSLRAAVLAAASGDTIDMTTLDCVITLAPADGEINITQSTLTLAGPGRAHLTISGGGAVRVLRHQTGVINPETKLYISGMTISDGYTYSSTSSKGGCIVDDGFLHLTDTTVSGCHADTYSGTARGGAIYATHFTMTNSAVRNSMVSCNTNGTATAGGVFGRFLLGAYYSTIANNQAFCEIGGTAKAGATYTLGTTTLEATTISGNSSSGDFGGAASGGGQPFSLVNSTISGNSADRFVGGVNVGGGGSFSAAYSTIVSNTAAQGSASVGDYRSPGVHLVTPVGLQMTNSILANNTYGVAMAENDISSNTLISAFPKISSSLIGVATISIPSDNLTNVCPLLGPLRDNGGPTKTHALLSGSPAIDAGTAGASPPAHDQRGPGFARIATRGAGVIDIGAYEVQGGIIFDAGFDGCPSLP
jgi:hypothetical protein